MHSHLNKVNTDSTNVQATSFSLIVTDQPFQKYNYICIEYKGQGQIEGQLAQMCKIYAIRLFGAIIYIIEYENKNLAKAYILDKYCCHNNAVLTFN